MPIPAKAFASKREWPRGPRICPQFDRAKAGGREAPRAGVRSRVHEPPERDGRTGRLFVSRNRPTHRQRAQQARAAQNFLEMQSPLGEVKEALGCVVGDLDRAGDIVDRIREHIKKAPPRKQCFDLNAAIDEVIVLARSVMVQNGVSVAAGLADGLSPIRGDRVQLQQVVLNLVLNAVEAMGSVEVGTRELLITTEQDDTRVLVAVRDSGPGVDPTQLERIFEAFYTTKSSGTGMGLSICRSIVAAHGGRLWADANEPRGAVFQFTLPGAERSS